jgi:hypothetical protein
VSNQCSTARARRASGLPEGWVTAFMDVGCSFEGLQDARRPEY